MVLFRDRAKELGHPNPDTISDMDVWLYIIKHQPKVE